MEEKGEIALDAELELGSGAVKVTRLRENDSSDGEDGRGSSPGCSECNLHLRAVVWF